MLVKAAGCSVQGAGCRVQGAGCRVQGARCRVQGARCRVQGAGCRVHVWALFCDTVQCGAGWCGIARDDMFAKTGQAEKGFSLMRWNEWKCEGDLKRGRTRRGVLWR